VLLFGAFFLSLAVLTLASWLSATGLLPHDTHALAVLRVAAPMIGIVGLFASARLYLVPARPAWNTNHTPTDFMLSALLLGCAAYPAIICLGNSMLKLSWLAFISSIADRDLRWPLVASAALWGANHVVRVIRLRMSRIYEHRASCSLLNTYSLRGTFLVSFAFVGLAVLLMMAGLPLLVFPAVLAGVIASRYLFFVSVVPLNMALTFVRQVHA
jgi:DMSO reductase anchor subunit